MLDRGNWSEVLSGNIDGDFDLLLDCWVGLTRAIHGPRPAGVSCVDVFPGCPAR